MLASHPGGVEILPVASHAAETGIRSDCILIIDQWPDADLCTPFYPASAIIPSSWIIQLYGTELWLRMDETEVIYLDY